MAAKETSDRGLDPLNTSHPVGTGVGAAGGAVAGAALGSAGGPVGTVVGGVIGAVAGGLAGRGMAQAIDPAQEDAYWRGAHRNEPYYNPDRSYEDYEPAYRMGWESRTKYDGGTYDQYEPAFRNDWDTMKGSSRLNWDEAKHAVRAGWHRIEKALPGDADRDGR